MIPLMLATVLACSAPQVGDGDTWRCWGERWRLWGVDAPELHPPSHRDTYPLPPPAWAADAARTRLAQLVRGGVRCEQMDTDRYRRPVVRCSSPATRDLARTLTREGLVVDWSRYSGGAYAADEAWARRHRRGMWR